MIHGVREGTTQGTASAKPQRSITAASGTSRIAAAAVHSRGRAPPAPFDPLRGTEAESS